MGGRSGAALRWVATLVEPLLSTNQRIRHEIEFRDIARSESRWFATYTAGILSGITTSLPLIDPWRSVEVDDAGTARWPDGRLFGQISDAADVLQSAPELEASGVDPTTIALAEGIATDAAALIVISFGGWRPAREALLDTFARGDGDAMFDRAANSIRWSEHRRRAYRPESFDVWLDHLSLEWVGWANEICDDQVYEHIEQEIENGASLERETLTAIALDLDLFD